METAAIKLFETSQVIIVMFFNNTNLIDTLRYCLGKYTLK